MNNNNSVTMDNTTATFVRYESILWREFGWVMPPLCGCCCGWWWWWWDGVAIAEILLLSLEWYVQQSFMSTIIVVVVATGYFGLRADTPNECSHWVPVRQSVRLQSPAASCTRRFWFLATDPNRAETENHSHFSNFRCQADFTSIWRYWYIDLYTYIHLYNIYKKQQ